MMTRALMVLLGALSGYLLFSAAASLGVGAVLVYLFIPLPAAVLGMRLGPPWGGAVVGLTMLALLATSGVSPTLLYLLQFGLPAALLPWLLSRGIHWDRAIVTTLALVLASGAVMLLGAASGTGQSPVAFINAQIDSEINQAVTLMQEFAGAEQSPEAAEALREVTASMGELMRRAYPAMLVVVCSALQLFTVGILALVARPTALPGTAFARWRSPELLIWVLIAAGFVVVFSAGTVQSLAINGLIILLPVYFLQGLAVFEHYLAPKVSSPVLRGLGCVFLLVINPLPMIVTGVGVFDLWVDFRKPRLRNKDE